MIINIQENNEIKFYLPAGTLFNKFHYKKVKYNRFEEKMDLIRKKSIELINRYCTGVYEIVCDKRLADQRKFQDSKVLGNWLFANTLCTQILPNIRYVTPPIITYDKGRLTAAASEQFNLYLVNKDLYLRMTGVRSDSQRLGEAHDCSSYAEPGIWAADIVAGAIKYEYETGDGTYTSLLTKTIHTGRTFYWKRKGGGPRGTPNQA